MPLPPTQLIPASFRLPQPTKAKIREIALWQHRSLVSVVIDAIDDYHTQISDAKAAAERKPAKSKARG